MDYLSKGISQNIPLTIHAKIAKSVKKIWIFIFPFYSNGGRMKDVHQTMAGI
jgi:hypothetical protein